MSTAIERGYDEASIKQRTCQECGMLLDDAGEFHPSAFCVLKKAGRDPWAELQWIEERLGRRPLPPKPPLVKHLRLFQPGSSDA